MAVTDLGCVRIFADSEGVEVYFRRDDDVTKSKVKELKGRWNPTRTNWRIVSRFVNRTSDEIAAEIAAAVEAAAPPWWKEACARLSRHACVSRKYLLKVGISGVRIQLPRGHPGEYYLEKLIQGASRDGQAFLVTPEGVRNPETQKIVERMLREDKKIFDEAAEFIGERAIAGRIVADAEQTEKLGLKIGSMVPADLSFLSKADPDMPTSDMQEWALTVHDLMPDDGGYTAVLRYAPAGKAYPFLRNRRAQTMPSASLGEQHARAKFERFRIRK